MSHIKLTEEQKESRKIILKTVQVGIVMMMILLLLMRYTNYVYSHIPIIKEQWRHER